MQSKAQIIHQLANTDAHGCFQRLETPTTEGDIPILLY
jgi:hypothetical protein